MSTFVEPLENIILMNKRKGQGLSVKVEAPDVLRQDPHRADLDPREHALFAAARGIMARCGMARMNYLGPRFRGATREASCYLDGFRASQMK